MDLSVSNFIHYLFGHFRESLQTFSFYVFDFPFGEYFLLKRCHFSKRKKIATVGIRFGITQPNLIT